MKILFLFLVKGEGRDIRYQKHIVQGFDGQEVSLNTQKTKLERFKDAAGEGFREVK